MAKKSEGRIFKTMEMITSGFHQPRGCSATPNTFNHLLRWLDQGIDSDGERYLEMRRRLVGYFDRKDCLYPDDLADETLDRVTRRLEDRGYITGIPPAKYCYSVAKFVFLEYLRKPQVLNADAEQIRAVEPLESAVSDWVNREDLLDRLDYCLNKLKGEDRELILEYYTGEYHNKIERRRNLAAKLGISMNAVSIRAFRIRHKLELAMQNRLR